MLFIFMSCLESYAIYFPRSFVTTIWQFQIPTGFKNTLKITIVIKEESLDTIMLSFYY